MTSVQLASSVERSPFDPAGALLDWYAQHRRDLPWRRDQEPYHVLVSEFMLQQTQVDRVVPYFEKFMERFPTLAQLAAASRAEVVQAWGGLGYNRRAVHLHQLALIVQERYEGQLPGDRKALLELPGIGPYTAGAILSIGFGKDEPALDTNARRVLARYSSLGPLSLAALQRRVRQLLPRGRASEWNQGLMDLGASVCLRREPRCLLCPLRQGCASAGHVGAPERRSASRYVGSMRYYRGRLLAALRSAGPGERVPLAEINRRLHAQGVTEPPVGWQAVGAHLARDGLAAMEETSAGATIGLPGSSRGASPPKI